MFIISEFHLNALQSKAGNPFFDDLIKFYTPYHNAYEAAYTVWKNTSAQKEDSTLTLNQLLGQTTNKLNIWQPAIQVAYAVGTTGYLKFFSDGRAPFATGSIDTRIAAFLQLDEALTGEAGLTTVKTSVHDFWQLLHDARNAQEGKKVSTGSGSADVEKARQATAIAMYSDFVDLLKHFIPAQEQAALYVDEQRIRNHEQLVYTGSTPAKEQENILKHKFDPLTETLRCKNTAVDTVTIYFSASATAMPAAGQPSLTLTAAQEQTVNPVDIGYADDKRYLNIYNPDDGDAKWEVEIG